MKNSVQKGHKQLIPLGRKKVGAGWKNTVQKRHKQYLLVERRWCRMKTLHTGHKQYLLVEGGAGWKNVQKGHKQLIPLGRKKVGSGWKNTVQKRQKTIPLGRKKIMPDEKNNVQKGGTNNQYLLVEVGVGEKHRTVRWHKQLIQRKQLIPLGRKWCWVKNAVQKAHKQYLLIERRWCRMKILHKGHKQYLLVEGGAGWKIPHRKVKKN